MTDVTNASRTQLMNLNTLQWDRDILRDFGIPIQMLPVIVSSSELYGTAKLPAVAGVAIRSVAISAISKPLWSARPASSREKQRIPTAPAASC